MSTPEISGSSIIKKYSPFCKGINKNLLTPCRQVGLSRKRKTSFNSSARSSENLNISVTGEKNYPGEERTPVTHIGRTKNKSLLNIQTTPQELSADVKNKSKEKDIKIRKKDLLQSFTSEDLFDTNDDQPSLVEKHELTGDENASETVIDKTHQIFKAEFYKNENNVEQSTPVHKTKNEPTKRTLSSEFTNFESICIKSEKSFNRASDSNSDDDFVINKNKAKQRRTKHLNKTASYIEEDSFENGNPNKKTNCIKKCKIQLQKLSEDEIKPNVFDNSKCKTLNKKSSSIDIDDSDFFTSTPEEEKMKRKNLEKKMTLLETQVKQKRVILENLERASIYKGKHNIPELKQLTSLWLDGCVQALKDLLTHLQAHGPIDLTTLLNNMQIPKEIVAKLPL